MKKVDNESSKLRPEYRREDFGPMARGKYAERLRESSNIVVLDPDIAQAFPYAQKEETVSKSVIKGLDELQRELSQFEDKVESVSGTRQIPIEELLTPDFMARFTSFASVDEMFDQSGFNIESTEDFDNILTPALDAFIAANTLFPTWDELIAYAGAEYTEKLLQE